MEVCIFDDEAEFRNRLHDITEDYFDETHPGLSYAIRCFATTRELLWHIAAEPADVVFLDIASQEDEDDGLWAARWIRSMRESAHIVFISSRKDKMARAFDGMVRPTDFLVKPLEKERVHVLLGNIVRQKKLSGGVISLKFGRIEYLLRLSEIFSMQTSRRKTLVTTASRTVEATNTFSSLLSALPDNFVQIDKGLVVNLALAERIDYAARTVAMKDGSTHHMSRNARQAVRQAAARLNGGHAP